MNARPETPAAAAPAVRGVLSARLWRLALTQPHLLGAHAAGYATLLHEGAAPTAAVLRRQALLLAACWGALVAAVTLMGVALMLWAAAPTGTLAHPWMLALVPALPLVAVGMAWPALHRGITLPLWAALQSQLAADAALLRAHGS